MWSNKTALGILSESIFQNDIFLSPGNYTVKLGVSYYSKSQGSTIKVFAAAGLTQVGAALAYMPSPSTSILLWNYTGSSFSSLTEFVFTVNIINSNNPQILIYPLVDGISSGPQADMVIDYVVVCRTGMIDEVIYKMGGIPDGITNADRIKVGSSFPSGFGVVNNSNSLVTELKASQFTDFAHNTEIVCNEEGYLQAEIIEPYIGSCVNAEVNSNPDDPCDFNHHDDGRPFNNSNDNSIVYTNIIDNNTIQEQVFIYPNPNTGSFVVKLSQAGANEIVITNSIGVVVFKSQLLLEVGEHSLNTGLPPGNYIFTLQGPGHKFRQKLVIY